LYIDVVRFTCAAAGAMAVSKIAENAQTHQAEKGRDAYRRILAFTTIGLLAVIERTRIYAPK
jgi:hypothetical protein